MTAYKVLMRAAKLAAGAESWCYALAALITAPDRARFVLRWVTRNMDPPRIIYDREGGSPYLSRWYAFGAPVASDGKPVFDHFGNPREGVTWDDRKGPIGVYVHRFHRGDDDDATHSHPWLWSVSLILAGGYIEERRMRGTNIVVTRTVKPWMLNFIRGDDFHRVDLIEKDAWSLFFAGPRVSSWSFWDRKTGETMPWREFIARKRGQVVNELHES